jgi:hypothetical protein
MPLDAAVQLARALVQTLAGHHEAQRAVGPFDASSTTIDSLGYVRLSASLNPAAAAPELAAGADADLLSDLYSLGAVFYRLFSGLTPADAQRRAGGHLPPPSCFGQAVRSDPGGGASEPGCRIRARGSGPTARSVEAVAPRQARGSNPG